MCSEQCEQFFQKKLFTLKRDQAAQCQKRILLFSAYANKGEEVQLF